MRQSLVFSFGTFPIHVFSTEFVSTIDLCMVGCSSELSNSVRIPESQLHLASRLSCSGQRYTQVCTSSWFTSAVSCALNNSVSRRYGFEPCSGHVMQAIAAMVLSLAQIT